MQLFAQPTSEPHRPLIHFTPQKAWMNDPNGMVYYNGTYHLFYQHYPDSTVWGPMHWGHATSTDMIRWKHQPIALYPDSLGYIFSGSAVVDSANTSGFGRNGKVPLVAIFTHHNPNGEKADTGTFQYQSLAYSLDDGMTWTKYAGNPVLNSPGFRDFRDPKVRWHGPTKRWIMTLATKDRITFYSSPNLKEWKRESEFGATVGAHGRVWECPDLFPLQLAGKTRWVLLVSINPGGPNGGSATQYFVGDFDGKRFTSTRIKPQWLDYGPDNYAGVTWSNTGNRTLFMGWMSNWDYATVVPTKSWRSAMTVPRELALKQVQETYYLTSQPVTELSSLDSTNQAFTVSSSNPASIVGPVKGAMRIDFTAQSSAPILIALSNSKGQRIFLGYDKTRARYFIDRRSSGDTSFKKGFGAVHSAPRLTTDKNLRLTLIIDKSSVELFADDGLSVMTSIFFPDEDITDFRIIGQTNEVKKQLKVTQLKPALPPPTLKGGRANPQR